MPTDGLRGASPARARPKLRSPAGPFDAARDARPRVDALPPPLAWHFAGAGGAGLRDWPVDRQFGGVGDSGGVLDVRRG